MNLIITSVFDALLTIILVSAVLYVIYDALIGDKLNKKSVEEINGVKLGDVFKLICEIDEGVRLYLDTETKIMYLVSEEGITPILDAKGKPRKYTEFIESIRGKE